MGRLDHVLAQLIASAALRGVHLVVGAALVVSGACGRPPSNGAAADSPAGEGGAPYSLDSALTLFRIGLEPVTELDGGAASMDSLFARLSDAVHRSDTSALRGLVMSRREFAWLYYPTSPFTRAPTRQEPGLVWFLHIQDSQKGAGRLLRAWAGQPLPLLRNDCRQPVRVEGVNRLWDDCLQTLVVHGDTIVTRLVGGVYERNGRFKFFSYSNDM